MDFKDMFSAIGRYHTALGHNKPAGIEARMQSVRNGSLALVVELVELVDSLPWKPWRKIEDQPMYLENAKREVIDILFFLVGICEDLEITGYDLELKFISVLRNNFERLESGYSKKGGDANGQ